MDLEMSFLTKILILAVFGPEMKTQKSNEVSGCTEINIKATRDMKSANKDD